MLYSFGILIHTDDGCVYIPFSPVSSFLRYVASIPLMFFPWVDMNGVSMNTGFDDCLLKDICGNYTGPAPASCKNMPTPPKGC